MKLRACCLLCALVALPRSASAEWLTLGSRAISRSASADPDAPVTGYAYGPRARASLGTDIAVLTSTREQRALRLGLLGVVLLEDAARRQPLPGEAGRTWLALSASWAYERPFAALFPAELELGVELGRRSAFTLDGFRLGDSFRANDVPYGAGGTYLGLDAALRGPLRPQLIGMSRLTLRSYANAFPGLLGQTEASDHTASFLEEGAKASAALELGLRLDTWTRAAPVLAIYADVIAPHDDSAKTLWLARALLGVALPGQRFELEPYVDAEAGHGQGLLVNRSQLRLGIGARLHAR